MSVRVLAGEALIRQVLSEEKTLGGIVLPDSRRAFDDKYSEGLRGDVVALGPPLRSEKDGRETPWEIRVGDRVLYSNMGSFRFLPREIKADGETLWVVRAEKILAVLEP